MKEGSDSRWHHQNLRHRECSIIKWVCNVLNVLPEGLSLSERGWREHLELRRMKGGLERRTKVGPSLAG